jgi:lysophospholipase L1-like esterase
MNNNKFLKLQTIGLFLSGLLLSVSLSAQDWPNLKRYQEQNETLKEKPVPKGRVVFMGNSITDFWIGQSPEFFETNHFVDRGISGQTSPQMLLRFRQDVIDLKPRAVVIECGTNDIAGNTGYSTLEMIEDNIASMAELAKANKIKVILGSVLPANKFGWKPELHPAERIDSLNQWIRQYAKKNKMVYLDYYSSLVDEQQGMKAEYSKDGVHPNKEGYTVMERVVMEAIRK